MLDQLIIMAIRLDNLLHARGFGSLPGTETEPMDVGTTHLSPKVRQHRRQQGLCSYGRESDHPGTPVPEEEPGEEATGRCALLHLPR
jgi:hypothetical protein